MGLARKRNRIPRDTEDIARKAATPVLLVNGSILSNHLVFYICLGSVTYFGDSPRNPVGGSSTMAPMRI